MHIDALAFTGHKGLLGPQGIGGFALREDLAAELTPLIAGGTGSLSHTEFMAGLPARAASRPELKNLPGIAGFTPRSASLRIPAWIRSAHTTCPDRAVSLRTCAALRG